MPIRLRINRVYVTEKFILNFYRNLASGNGGDTMIPRTDKHFTGGILGQPDNGGLTATDAKEINALYCGGI